MPTPRPARILGAILLIPAGVLLVVGLLVPFLRLLAVAAVTTSAAGDSRFTGFAAFRDLPGRYWHSYLGAIALIGLPLLVCLLVAPAMAYVLRRAVTPARLTARTIAAVLLAACAPLVITVGWPGLRHRVFAGPPALDLAVLAGTLVAVALGVALLATLTAGTGRSLGAVVGVLVLGTLSLGWQLITVPGQIGSSVTGGSGGLWTPAYAARFALAAGDEQYGSRRAAMAVVLLVVVGACGLAAWLGGLLLRPRLVLAARRPEPLPAPSHRRDAVQLAAGAALAVLVVGALAAVLIPIPSAAGRPDSFLPLLGTALARPALVSLGAVVIAAAAGVAIGALRPAGQHSWWLLLPFAPGLFVTMGPLEALDRQFDPVSAGLICVPAVFGFALLSAGHRDRWLRRREEGDRFAWRALLAPAVPFAVLAWLAALLVETVDPAGAGPMLDRLGVASSTAVLLAAPVALLAAVLLIVLQLGYLDRLTLVVAADATDPTGTAPDVSAALAGAGSTTARPITGAAEPLAPQGNDGDAAATADEPGRRRGGPRRSTRTAEPTSRGADRTGNGRSETGAAEPPAADDRAAGSSAAGRAAGPATASRAAESVADDEMSEWIGSLRGTDAKHAQPAPAAADDVPAKRAATPRQRRTAKAAGTAKAAAAAQTAAANPPETGHPSRAGAPSEAGGPTGQPSGDGQPSGTAETAGAAGAAGDAGTGAVETAGRTDATKDADSETRDGTTGPGRTAKRAGKRRATKKPPAPRAAEKSVVDSAGTDDA
ncbi:hypothetical protein [Actinocatenispora comari]|uniref:Uncharacterized protein n=1 Tax=Actinocatenispora comari TaxID=2807577 RepID=A0A8J4AI77_9ACTN|nr:hypothetical protein [Actinocatenispora comari]GIL31961.1 hypothetical protein NUM_72150 [Actinocatenispora comari]